MSTRTISYMRRERGSHLYHLEGVRTHEGADIFLVAQLIEVVVHAGENIHPLIHVARELGQCNGVVRLTACLLGAVINQDRVPLAPAPVLVRVGRPHHGVVPQCSKALVALRACFVVGRGEVEFLAAPDRDDLLAVVGRQELVHHAQDVLGPRRGPDDDPKGLDAVPHKLGRVAPCEEPGGLPAVGAVQDGAVEVDDHQQRAGVGAALGQEGGAYEVGGRGVGDAA